MQNDVIQNVLLVEVTDSEFEMLIEHVLIKMN